MAMDIEEAEKAQAELEQRITAALNGAARTWDELVSAVAGVRDPGAFDLDAEEALRVHRVCATLAEMVSAGSIRRYPRAGADGSGEPRFDTYEPGRR